MANEDLKLYLKERLLELDPTLDASPGGEMERAVINPLIRRIGTDATGINITEFIVSRLSEDPNTAKLDVVTSGSVIKDILAKPLELLLEPLQREINFLSTQQSLSDSDALSKVELDALLANVFVDRRTGSTSFGTLQVYFSTPRVTSIDATIIFFSTRGIKFRSPSSLYFGEDDFLQSGDLHYIEFDVESLVSHSGANIPADDVKHVRGLDDVVRVTNPYAMVGGSTSETSGAFLRRAQNSLTERSFNTKRGIETLLFDNYENLASVGVVGFAEPEMQRDILTANATFIVDTTGKPLVTSTKMLAVSMVGAAAAITEPNITKLPWTNSDFHFTNVLDLVFSTETAYNAVAPSIDDTCLFRTFDSGDSFDPDELGRIRHISATQKVTVGAKTHLRLVAEDFTIVASSNSPALTHPNSNFLAPRTPQQRLRTKKADGTAHLWRGAPLPFTDAFQLQGDGGFDALTSYTPSPGKDYLVVSGYTTNTYSKFISRAYPVRGKADDNNIIVDRVDKTIISRNKITLPLDTYLSDPNATMESETPEVVAMGAPGLVNLSKLSEAGSSSRSAFGGVTTVEEGIPNSGGAALYLGAKAANAWWMTAEEQASLVKQDEAYIELVPDPVTRPLGWASLGVSVGDFISLAAYARSTKVLTGETLITPTDTMDLPDWWSWARISEVSSNDNNHLIKVIGLEAEVAKGDNAYPVFTVATSISNSILTRDRIVSSANCLLGFELDRSCSLVGTTVVGDDDPFKAKLKNWAALVIRIIGPETISAGLFITPPLRIVVFTDDLDAPDKPDFGIYETPNPGHEDIVYVKVVVDINNVTFTEIKDAIEGVWWSKPEAAWGDVDNKWPYVAVVKHPSDKTIQILYNPPTLAATADDASALLFAAVLIRGTQGATSPPPLFNHAYSDADTRTALGLTPKALTITNSQELGDDVVYTCANHGLVDGDAAEFVFTSPINDQTTSRVSLVKPVDQDTFKLRKSTLISGSTFVSHTLMLNVIVVPATNSWGLAGNLLARMPFAQLPAVGESFSYSLPSTAGAFYASPRGTRFRLHWTVYKNSIPTYLPNGNLHTSYTDFAFAPAFDTSGKNNWGEVVGRFNSPLTKLPHIDGFDYSKKGTFPDEFVPVATPIVKYGSNIKAQDAANITLPTGLDNNVSWAILRLRDDFTSQTLEDSTTLVSRDPSAEKVTLFTITDKYDQNQAITTSAQGGEEPGVSFEQYHLPLNSPLLEQEYLWSDVGGNTAKLARTKDNLYSTAGFSVPIDLGAAVDHNLISQVYKPVVIDTDTSISVSGIPGSYPFIEEFINNPPLVVSANKIHLGGMTDVYIKELYGSESFASFNMRSKFIAKPEIFGAETTYNNEVVLNDIVATASDGKASANSKILYSAKLTDGVSGVSAAELAEETFLSLELVDTQEVTLKGSAVNVVEVNLTQGYVRTDVVLNSLDVEITSIKYRLLRLARNRVDTPHRILARGFDLRIQLQDAVVYTDTKFEVDQEITEELFLKILSGNNKGNYQILLAQEDSLTLVAGTVLSGPESLVKYEVYARGVGIDLPLIRVEKMELASADGTGLRVPYRKSVGVIAESFSGLNNDPLVFSAGELVLRPKGDYSADADEPVHTKVAHAEVTALYHTSSTHSWLDQGIIVYDVIKILNQTEANTYWYVTAITGPVGDPGRVLLLDRAVITKKVVDLSGSIGKPSIGDVKMYFKDRTYVEVTPDTELVTDDKKAFRPSPAETATIFSSDGSFTDIKIDPYGANELDPTPADPSNASLSSSTLDFSKLQVRVGDVLTISRKVLTGGVVAYDLANSLTGKTLVITINGKKRSVVFTSLGTLSIHDVSSQINSSMTGLLTTKVSDDKRLKIYSFLNSITIEDSSTGVLMALNGGLDMAITGDIYTGATNSYGSSALLEVTSVSYTPATSISKLTVKEISAVSGQLEPDTLDAPDPIGQHPNAEVFITVSRPRRQMAFPADMVATPEGLFYYSFVASSKEPLTTDRVAENTYMRPDKYLSLGYCLHVDNSNYSYSMAEVCDISVTPIMLSDQATDFSAQFALPNARLDVTYDRSPIVESAQSLLLSENNRVVCNNPLTRHFLPAYLYLNVATSGGGSTEKLKYALVDAINAVYPNRTFTAFDIEDTLISKGVTGVKHPITMYFLTYNADRSITLNMTTDSLTLDSRYHVMNYANGITVTGA